MFKITLKHSLWFIFFANLIIWSTVFYISDIKKNKETIAVKSLDEKNSSIQMIEPSKPVEIPQESWFTKNWPIITSVMTTIPTIVIKWKEMFKKIKRKHKKKYVIRN